MLKNESLVYNVIITCSRRLCLFKRIVEGGVRDGIIDMGDKAGLNEKRARLQAEPVSGGGGELGHRFIAASAPVVFRVKSYYLTTC